MAIAFGGDELRRSSRQSFRDLFTRSVGGGREWDEEDELRWAAIERLPTYDRVRKSVLKRVIEDGTVQASEIDVKRIGIDERGHLTRAVLNAVEEDNERFLRRLRVRVDRVGIEIPKIEIRYEQLTVEGNVHVGGRALPTLLNAALNSIESILGVIKLAPSNKKKIHILKDANGIIKPSRITLLLGPPGAGKTTFMLALAGKLDTNLRKSGNITYCGHKFSEFVPQRTCAYISQQDLHHGEMTVRETLDFSGRCLGVGTRYEIMAELSRREKEGGIKPDPEIDAYMKAISFSGQKTSLVTDYVLKILGLDICSDIMVGDDMRRGISGGQKKRVTTGEMLVGPAKVLLMDEISSGLDSSTTFQIIKYMKQIAEIMDVTMIISLLQPPPETYNLFDDIILLTEGQIVYQGPRENVLEFFVSMGFKCPERKGVADFLQEVTSKKDQEQYWYKKEQRYAYISASEFAQAFKSFHIGEKLVEEVGVPYDKLKAHPAALVKEKYGISKWELLRACISREWLLMKRNSFIYIFKSVQLTVCAILAFTVYFRTEMPHGQITDGGKYLGALFFSLVCVMFNGMAELAMTAKRLPIFYKQRDFLFYPAWAFALPYWILKIPISILSSAIWAVLTYYTIGFAPSPGRFFRQLLIFCCIYEMAIGLFRFISAVARTLTAAITFGTFTMVVIFVLGGFVVSKNDLAPWLRWAYYISPMSYGQNAIAMNEFLDKRWSTPNTDLRFNQSTVGKVILHSRGFYTDEHMYWICVIALIGFALLYNVLFIAALTFLNHLVDSKTLPIDDDDKKIINASGINVQGTSEGVDKESPHQTSSAEIVGSVDNTPKKGTRLSFQHLSLVFDHINYYVDMPAEMKAQGVEGDRLQLLRDVSGAFRPGVLTALVGVSGAGKTTLMDVLAGRKTGGYIEGSISISGYPKNQATFTRVSGYCEQNDIHSPNLTVYESVLFSAWLRLSTDVKEDTKKMFVEEVMQLVELNPIRNSCVGLPGVNGLSTEQRKRLTIAVELVANPAIIFMDEPTSGLDARAAAIVMRTVRNTVDTGRTVVCTIHQPSIDIFEAFDELLLMKRGGRVFYAGQLGRHSHKLIEYFEAIPGVPKIEDGQNPATWMLDISSPAAERQLGVDFADIYANSSLYQMNQEVIKEASTPPPGSKDLSFPTQHSQPFVEQCKACFWKQYWSYWRNPQYNGTRFFMTIAIGLIFGLIFWNKGQKIKKEQDISNLMGSIYASLFFLGNTISSSGQTVVSIERTVLYREKAAGMYSPLPYVFAQVAIETFYIAIQSIIYVLLLYSMIGFQWTPAKFFWLYYFFFSGFVYFSAYGMMFIALTPALEVGNIVVTFFISFWNLFSGFLIPRNRIPIWWRWYYWCNPVAWTIYGSVVSQFGDLDSQIDVPGLGSMTVKNYLKQSLGFDHQFLRVVGVMPLVFILLFVSVFAFALKTLNFQKR